MSKHVRHCFDCGARSDETPFPVRKPPGERMRCSDCLTSVKVDRQTQAVTAVQTRARYRAGYRYRASLPQLDLVDLVRPPP